MPYRRDNRRFVKQNKPVEKKVDYKAGGLNMEEKGSMSNNEAKRNSRDLKICSKTLTICSAPPNMVAIYGDDTGEYLEKVYGLALVTDGEYEHVRAIIEGEGVLDVSNIKNVVGFDIMMPGESEEDTIERWAKAHDYKRVRK